jgi:deazaflavin-dependent oxidoreductase (nitroreductase family)
VSVEVTPPGTRGPSFPRFPTGLRVLFDALGDVIFAFFGKRMRVQGRPVLRLETVGARTGTKRHTMVCWFPDLPITEGAPATPGLKPESWVCVASLAGAARHPGWFHNLARHPDRVWIRFPGGDRMKVRPTSLRRAEREEAWRRIVSLAPGFGKYQEQTDRVIPVVRLVREG